ncbi:uncharacterized protein LOC116844560 isoform X2 [Odontomachus brunneus]|uniref:uncharacterized protein LOC116844560 isoform X2 n=1 Tax=Odontomachus brunneus TaxID=486640 RepID=UPI0013F1A40C|nr:uncharacterized protein LOC116844560 isoform X2 [Odontomachus brunneus]
MYILHTKRNMHYVTMSRPINKVFVLILLMNQVVNIFGKLTTLSGQIYDRRRKVLCISENDGSALVWNADLKFTYYKSRYIIDPNAKNFSDTCNLYNNQIDCKLDNESGCLNFWERNHWKIINSIDIPMGPVFDRRWEGFKEYMYSAEKTYNLKYLNTNTVVLPFSIRATKDVHLLICNNDYVRNLCYWVIIGGWENTKSVIRKCLKGVSNIGVYPPSGSECAVERVYLNHTPLAQYEWRTFVLTWNSETRNISLYDSDQLIMTYRDMDTYNNTNFTYKLYIRSALSLMIRLHEYDYLYTSIKNTILTSNIFYINTEDICLQMLIGLCAQCDADVSLHTPDEILKTIIVKGSSVAAVHGLPMWQPVKITAKIATYNHNSLKIVVTPKLNLNVSNPIWAIANVRQCPSNGCLRQSVAIIRMDWDIRNREYFWPKVVCQKLFYKKQSVVQIFNDADLNVELDDKNCPVGFTGPACKFHCDSALNSTNCNSVVICNDNGCTCTSGYTGPGCNISCDNNLYGHACKNKCGSCLQNQQCDPISGVCHNGCRNTETYVYAPPLCQIVVGKPNETEFIFTNQTTIVATVSIKWEKEYEETDLFYKFNIQTPDGKSVKQYEWRKISQNSTKLEETFENLEHDTTYSIQCVFLINQVPVYGKWKNVDTHCDWIHDFRITPNITNITIDMGDTENQTMYSCPTNSYRLLFQQIDNQNSYTQMTNVSITSFPYTFSRLTSHTFYIVIVLHGNKQLFSQIIRTLEAECRNGFYGLDCRRKCGSCLHDKQCDRASGVCPVGCKSTANYTYISPLCQTGLGAPNELQTVFKNQTTIVVSVPMKWEEEYEKADISYSFDIKTLDGNSVDRQAWKGIFSNTIELIGRFENLQPATTYQIMCSLSVGQTVLNDTWLSVETTCDTIHDFRITPNVTTLMINMGDSKNQTLYPCPTNSYRLLFQKIDNKNSYTQTTNISITSFPYTLSRLTPHTSYIIIILHGNKQLFVRIVRTLKAECRNGFYGLDCRGKCGSCLHDKQCDSVSGACPIGCKSTANYTYIFPLCQTGLEAPNEIQIVFKNQTTIIATVSMKWKEEYEKADIIYSFDIKTLDGNSMHRQMWKRIFSNTTELIGKFENLQTATIYQIRCLLSIGHVVIKSTWMNVKTTCVLVKDFRITPNETSLTIDMEDGEKSLYLCLINSYRLLFQQADNQNDQMINASIISFPYTLSHLTPYTYYNIVILHGNKKLFTREICTLEGVPSEVRNLEAISTSSSRVKLVWASPQKPNGVITKYMIFLKVEEYFGCRDYGLSTTVNHIITRTINITTITISGLHPYAKYNVQIVAHNSRHYSKPSRATFHTVATEVPAVKFTQLRERDWILSWKPPENCTTILGPLRVARVEIRGISDAVKNFFVIKYTSHNYLDMQETLYGAERYVAKIFALRDYGHQVNSSAYEEYQFETPSKAPPKLTNLDVVEVDNNQMIHLRWQSPPLPTNGKLSNYSVRLCNKDKSYCVQIHVELNETCDLWDNYICKTVQGSNNQQIYVVAYNKKVCRPSPFAFVTKEMLSNTKPDAPRNFTYTIRDHGIVDIKWLHPWRTGSHLRCFRIKVEEISSNLRNRVFPSSKIAIHEYSVINYMREYSKRLCLLPSTKYIISIISVTTENVNSNMSTLNFSTPSTVNFKGNITSEVYDSDSTIVVHIPQIVDDTRNSILYIIVKGPHRDCNNYVSPHKSLWKQAGVQMYDIFWQAAAILAQNISNGMDFTIGNGDIYDNAINCYLVSGELYDITIIISEPNFHYEPIMITRKISKRIGVKQNHPESWLIPLVMIIFTAIVAFWFFRRKRQKSNKPLVLQDEMALSQNNKSYVHDKKVITESFKEDSSTPSDRQSLSRATTPEITNIVVESNDEEEEITSLVKVKDFEDYVRQAIVSGLLNKQYETFPRGQTQPWDYGKQPQNKTKNRYGNLIAYDETRVILKKLPDDAYSDYINANYITGYKKKKRYIATQGPKPNTVVDFWRMIWQEKVLIICMLANVVENGKTKCEQYWPDIGKKKKYGEIVVLNATHNVFADYCFRTLHITYENETRKVEHLHYTAWPDHGVPMYTHSVVTYLKKLLATPPGDGPVVVHCSAGVGRTGTIVLCDICLHRAAAEGMVDVFAETASIRRERANMVDNKQQYLLAHLALVECLITIPTTLPCNETLPTRIKELKKQLSVQQHQLQNTAWQDEALRPITSLSSLSECNRAKNRFPELISDKVSRIYLKRYPSSDEDSDYLSAVYVDGVKLQNQYLAAQLPMPSTINDFWRMITEFKVELIVMLQPPDPEDSTCCAIAPANGEFKPTPYLNIIVKEIVELENYTLQKLLLVDNSEKPSREQSVTILCCTEWKPGRNQPPPPVMALVTFWQATERIARGDGPTVTLCHDGVTGCGLYLALSFMLERMAVERECDICLSVRAVRRSRADFVGSLEHLEYLYDAAITYLEYFETYANFS